MLVKVLVLQERVAMNIGLFIRCEKFSHFFNGVEQSQAAAHVWTRITAVLLVELATKQFEEKEINLSGTAVPV